MNMALQSSPGKSMLDSFCCPSPVLKLVWLLGSPWRLADAKIWWTMLHTPEAMYTLDRLPKCCAEARLRDLPILAFRKPSTNDFDIEKMWTILHTTQR